MGALPKRKLTAEEYFDLDRHAEVRTEYHDGEVFPMVAVTVRHSRIVSNIVNGFHPNVSGKKCVALPVVRVQATASHYLYPDVALVCGKVVATGGLDETLTNPQAIFEVLSPSTADYDQAGKFNLYQKIASFEEYFLVAQDQYRVTAFRKQSANVWTMEIVTGVEAILRVNTSQTEVPMAEIYGGVEGL